MTRFFTSAWSFVTSFCRFVFVEQIGRRRPSPITEEDIALRYEAEHRLNQLERDFLYLDEKAALYLNHHRGGRRAH